MCELDSDDLATFRQLHAARECGIMYNVRLTMEEATKIELDYIEFQAYVLKKYVSVHDIDEECDWQIDEVSGEIYYWE